MERSGQDGKEVHLAAWAGRRLRYTASQVSEERTDLIEDSSPQEFY